MIFTFIYKKNCQYVISIAFMALFLSACIKNPIVETTAESDSVVSETVPPEKQIDDFKNYPLISLQQIFEHNVEADCWIGISDGVYDVTGFIESNSHPGGEAIFEGCGKDATELFDTRPMGSGTPHSNEARKLLVSYRIGNLIQ